MLSHSIFQAKDGTGEFPEMQIQGVRAMQRGDAPKNHECFRIKLSLTWRSTPSCPPGELTEVNLLSVAL